MILGRGEKSLLPDFQRKETTVVHSPNWRCGAKNAKIKKFCTSIRAQNREKGKSRMKTELWLQAQD